MTKHIEEKLEMIIIINDVPALLQRKKIVYSCSLSRDKYIIDNACTAIDKEPSSVFKASNR